MHLEALKRLPEGYPVRVRTQGRAFKGRLVGSRYSATMGDQVFEIQTDQGTSRFVTFGASSQIEPLENENAHLPRNSRGRSVQIPGSATRELLGEQISMDLANRTQLDSVVIGLPTGDLRNELEAEVLRAQLPGGEWAASALQGLVRAKRYLRAGSAYRTVVLSQGSKRVADLSLTLRPHCVVFDGSLPFLKWSPYWVASHRVVLLSKTERSYGPAVEEANRQYIQERANPDPLSDIPSPIESVEMMAYEVQA